MEYLLVAGAPFQSDYYFPATATAAEAGDNYRPLPEMRRNTGKSPLYLHPVHRSGQQLYSRAYGREAIDSLFELEKHPSPTTQR